MRGKIQRNKQATILDKEFHVLFPPAETTLAKYARHAHQVF